MAIIVKGSDFENAPEGMHQAVCVDVHDLGMVETSYKGKPKVQRKVVIYWEIAAIDSKGEQFVPRKRYTGSLNEKSMLFKDLKTWRGKPFTPDEIKSFDVEKLINAPATLLISHEDKEGTVYANVTAVARAEKGQELKSSGKWVRIKDRPTEKSGPGEIPPHLLGVPDDDSDVPF